LAPPPWDGFGFAWDIAPIALIVEETGGIGTAVSGKPIRFLKDGTVADAEVGILFTNRDREFHRKILSPIR
jgi:fructose-1,6-bisphosphatase/inositol monophosphatase family enzyme